MCAFARIVVKTLFYSVIRYCFAIFAEYRLRILAATSVLYYKHLTRMVLTKEKETGSEDEVTLLRSVNVPTIFL